MKIFLTGFFFVFIVSGCSNYSAIVREHQNDLVEFKIRPLDSVIQKSAKTFRIESVEINEKAMANNREFLKSKTLVLPFIVFDYWNHQTQYIIGKNQFKSQLENDIKSSFEVGMEQFGYRKSETNPDFEITISAKKVLARSTYTKNGFFYFALFAYGYSFDNSRGPYEAQVLFDIKTTEHGRSYNSEVEGGAILPLSLFRDDVDSEIERISRSLSISINEAVRQYSIVAPK